MLARRLIDQRTGDHVLELGGPKEDATEISDVLLRFRTRRGSCRVVPTLGSRLHTLTTAMPWVPRRAEAFAREALADLVRAGRIRELSVEASITRDVGAGARLDVDVSFLGRSSSERQQLIWKQAVTGGQ